jgi:hypothetical protein
MMDYPKRKSVLTRKPSVVIALGTPKPKSPPMPEMDEEMDEDEEMEEESLTCPKCGMVLADTPENQEYAASRAEEMEGEDKDYEEEA